MKYKYLARTQKGETQIGSVEAASESAAIKTLQGYDLVVIRLKAVRKISFLPKRINIFERVNRKEVMLFCRQLSTLVGAEVPLVQSLKALGEQTENYHFQETLFEIASGVDGGMLFSQALAKHPRIFSLFFVNLIKSGEVSGRLQESLEYLANYLEKEYYLISKIRGAMIYPAFILAVFLIIGVLMMIMVVPQLTSFLEEFSSDLPWTTRALIWTSNSLKTKGWILGLALVILGFGFSYFIKTSFGRRVWDNLKLKLPILGKVFKETYLARFTESLSTLIKGGVPIIEALTICGEVAGNTVFKEMVFEARDKIRVGQSLSSVLEKFEQFPAMAVQMIKTGEKTGKLDFILENLAGFYSKEVDRTVANLSQLIEPILIVVLGIMVGILVASILMPIYNIASS